jgi:16S rRNA (uracil1498-N3)-methyltransferase
VNRILLDAAELGPGGRVRLEGRRARHVVTVIRPSRGARLRVGLVRGPVGEAEVLDLSETAVELRVVLEGRAPEPPAVDLVLAMPRPKVLRRLLAAAASIGVGRVDVVNAWRVEKSYLDSPQLSASALEAALREGCEQGGGTWLPEIAVHRRLMTYLDEVRPLHRPALEVLLHPGTAHGLEETGVSAAAAVRVVVGPEGGFIAREVETFLARGFSPARLLEAVLRTETAVSVALGQIALLRRRDPPSGGSGGPD